MAPPVVVDLTAAVRNKHSPRRMPVQAIVDHIMQGTLVGTDAWFQNPTSLVSAHYGVGKNGEVHKYVAVGDEAWHAGVMHDATAPFVLKMYVDHPEANPNWYTVGIEHEGYTGGELTEAQYQATLWLHGQIIGEFWVPLDRDHVIGHHEINALHAGCPGTTFPFDRLLEDLRAGR